MARKHLSRSVLLESLESRQLYSTVSITDFGAKPDDGKDDTGAIIAAINASKPGDTILFDGGVFNLSHINLASNRNYVGDHHAELTGTSPDGHLFDINGDNVSVSNLIIDSGIMIQKNGGYNNNISIHDNVFYMENSGSNDNGITFTSGLQNSLISENYFSNPNAGGFGIYGYNYRNLTIKNNDLINLAAGMHVDAFGNSGDLLVQNNYIHGARGMGLEFQGAATNLKFIGNWYEHPELSSDFNRNNNSFAFSLILDKSSNILIKGNTVIAPERPDGTGCRIGFEVGGDNTLVTENYINGVNHTIAVNDGSGSCSVTIDDNYLTNYLQGIGGIRPNAITYKGSNDGSTTLDWSLNNSQAGRDSRHIYIDFNSQN